MSEELGVLIDLADVSMLQVSERNREPLRRIQGFIAFTVKPEDKGAA